MHHLIDSMLAFGLAVNEENFLWQELCDGFPSCWNPGKQNVEVAWILLSELIIINLKIYEYLPVVGFFVETILKQ